MPDKNILAILYEEISKDPREALRITALNCQEQSAPMEELYENDGTGVSRGITMFYHTICDKYLNIILSSSDSLSSSGITSRFYFVYASCDL